MAESKWPVWWPSAPGKTARPSARTTAAIAAPHAMRRPPRIDRVAYGSRAPAVNPRFPLAVGDAGRDLLYHGGHGDLHGPTRAWHRGGGRGPPGPDAEG